MQALCQLDAQGDAGLPDALAFIAEEAESPDVAAYARGLVEACCRARERIDALLAAAATRWDVSRMALVDRNVARVAVCELTERRDVPAAVALDEAIEIAKEFGAADSPAFVNGVLDAVRRQLPPGG